MAEISVRMSVYLNGDERAIVRWHDVEGAEYPVRVTIVDREGDGGELVDLLWDSRFAFLGFIQQLAREYDERYGITPPRPASGVPDAPGDAAPAVDNRTRMAYGEGR